MPIWKNLSVSLDKSEQIAPDKRLFIRGGICESPHELTPASKGENNMNKKRKVLRLLLIAALLVSLLTVPAYAAAPEITQNVPNTYMAVAGQTIQIRCTASGEEVSYQWYSTNGVLDGQTSDTLSLAVGDEHDGLGVYCRVTNAEGSVDTATCTLTVVSAPTLTTDIPATLSVNEGANITLTCAASGKDLAYQWYSTSSVLNGQTGPTLNLQAAAEHNGKGFYCQILNAAGAVSTQMCTVTVVSATPTPAPAPTVTKDPTGETVTEGGSAIFIARADNAQSLVWRFISADGVTTYDYTQVRSAFPTLGVAGGDTETLTLTGIPYELNGWKVACLFKGHSQDVVSAGALITVNQTAVTQPTITRQPTGAEMKIGDDTGFSMSVSATAPNGGMLSYQWYTSPTGDTTSLTPLDGATSATYRPIQATGTKYYCVAVWNHEGGRESQPVYSTMVKVIFKPADSGETQESHTHAFAAEWSGNDLSHWHECTCGAHQDEAFHTFEWTVTEEPTKKKDGSQTGICSVCGHETTETIPAGLDMDGEDGSGRGWLIPVFIVLVLAVLGTGGFLIWRILKKPVDDDSDYFQ